VAAICLHLTALLRFLAVLIIYQLVAVNVKLRDSVQQLFGFEKYEMSYAYSHRRMAIYVHCLQTEVLSVNSFTHTGVKPFKCEICKKKHLMYSGNLQLHMHTHAGDWSFS